MNCCKIWLPYLLNSYKKLLFFIVPKYTMMRGKNIKSTNSRFINEIDKEFIFKCENKK